MSVQRRLAFDLPDRFWNVPYVGSNFPASSRMFDEGTNCQGFAYAVLRHFGLTLPDFRSSELWADNAFTERVRKLSPLDLVMFNSISKAFGAHVGIYAGKGLVLHLGKSVGRPSIWSLAEFTSRPQYRCFLGAKRIRSRGVTQETAAEGTAS